jgi:hypothetical protein
LLLLLLLLLLVLLLVLMLLRLGSLLLLRQLITLLLLLLLLLPRVLLLVVVVLLLLLPRVRHIPTLPSLTLHLTVRQIHKRKPTLHVLLLVVHCREGRVPNRVRCDKVHAGVHGLIQGRQLCCHVTLYDSRLRSSSAGRPGRLLLPRAAVPTTTSSSSSSSRGLVHTGSWAFLLPEPGTAAAAAAAHASWLDCFWSLVKHHELP